MANRFVDGALRWADSWVPTQTPLIGQGYFLKVVSSISPTIGLLAIVACAAREPVRPPDKPIASSPPQSGADGHLSGVQEQAVLSVDPPQQKPSAPYPECIAATRRLAWDFGRKQLGIKRLALVAAPHFPIDGESEASVEDEQGSFTSRGFTESYDERYWYWLGLSDEIGVGHLAVSKTGDLELACAGRFDCTGLQENYAGSLTSKVPSACGEAEPSYTRTEGDSR